ncbi:3-methyladenine DNA glycosylase [Streptomyces sp. CC53]|uniref:DNA-3-methyladenine glycosylase I n=1 Tax=Streptomyces sp. CC53 TaxID=1906740 RepID=UPI0008DC98DA|nr:DNA-3-methyladenine glycosylase I [Streptomyces sp. CC53]OII65552.1 3-methyladenine DNA glycosylase [Streptomyces sp. CC53]
MTAKVEGPEGNSRCGWTGGATEFLDCHDTEEVYPVADDRRLFEEISLEGFQSGLSWRIILAKRENFRKAFAGFDFHLVAEFTEADLDRLLQDPGIVRHRGKVEAVVNNARRAVDLAAKEGSLAAYFWRGEPDLGEVDPPQTVSTSPASVALSKDLKKRDWKFVGPITVFAFVQAMGLINDHVAECVIRSRVEAERSAFTRPC